MIGTGLSVSAYAKNLTLHFRDVPIETVMKEIKKQTGYEFVYKKGLIDSGDKVTLNLTDVPLAQALNRIFNEDNGLQYEIVDKNILLSESPESAPYFKHSVSGVVTDTSGEPLIGVSVFVEGTKSGAATDIDGHFSVIVEKGNPKLRFSYVGKKTKYVPVKPGEDLLMVTLEDESQIMEEIVVTGYQQMKRESATGSFQTISAEDMAKRYTGDITSNLEGQVPGLVSYDNGNGKGITIRGTGSFQANTSPLVVVDGLPIEGGIESVNPYEVDNITILKDAAAASIYGARASNGVIVITTKKAREEKLTVEFNADVTVSERNDYGYMQWANAAEMVELERYNFNYLNSLSDRSAYNSLLNYYKTGRSHNISPATLLLLRHDLGELDDSSLANGLRTLSGNDYRREWQDAVEREKIEQQYNLAIRYNGRQMSNSLVVNYATDNAGLVNGRNDSFMLNYRGEFKVGSFLNLSAGLNIVSERSKAPLYDSEWGTITSFAPYMTMYDQQGVTIPMQAGFQLDNPILKEESYGFKSAGYNQREELGLSTQRIRRTNLRPWINARVNILDGWTATAQFQYEDIYYKSDALRNADSYTMRSMYNTYTAEDKSTGRILHHIPDGGMLGTKTSEGAFYTFRAQTDYSNTFLDKHEITATAGFEFREQHEKTYGNVMMGYDDATQTNSNYLMNWGLLKEMEGSAGVLGPDYPMYGAPESDNFFTGDILHRFYSLYAIANYVYDYRYALSLSCRLDKTDLFGADPKFRGRPLWSVGGSWNLHNEKFMREATWITALKLRLSYGLTGNIAQNVSSLLTAKVDINDIYGQKYATLNTPPNDQLRWEKTASWNAGVDFSFWGSRLGGSFDFYRKSGSDLLTVTDLDPTTGWSQLTINNGKMVNTGVELQLNGTILEALTPEAFGFDLGFNIAYNHNKVTKVDHLPATGSEALLTSTLHKGYPVNSLFSYDFAGMVKDGDMQYFSWRDHKGVVHTSSIESDEFTPADIVYSGSLDPKVMGSLTPEFSWQRFTLSAMMAWYTGHVMRADTENWTSEGSMYGYYNGLSGIDAVPSSYLDYWTTGDATKHVANGYAGGTHVTGNHAYMSSNVVSADFFKLRNIVLSYQFAPSVCRKLRLDDLRLRFQINNVCMAASNDKGIDPEANDAIGGIRSLRLPRSYTFSLFFRV